MNARPSQSAIVTGAITLGVLAACGWDPAPKKEAPAPRFAFGIEIASESTQITEPLLPNGAPDYAAAINASIGMGVNIENNSVRELASILGMNLPKKVADRVNASADPAPGKRLVGGISSEGIEEYFRSLSAAAPASDAIGTSIAAFEAEIEVLAGGYCSTTACPQIAGWLSVNEGALAALADAVEKPRFWAPLEEGANLFRAEAFSLDGFREACRALAARASLRLGDDNWARAAEDVLTAQKLAGHLGQSTLAAAQSTAAGCIDEANAALLRAAADPNLDVAASKALLDGLEELPPIGNFELVLQHERFRALAGVFLFRELAGDGGASAWRTVLSDGAAPEGLYRLEVSSIDWREALKVVNGSWDLCREIVWSSSETAAAQARQRLQEGLRFTSETRSVLGEDQLGKLLPAIDRNPDARPKLTRAFVDAAGLLPKDFVVFVRRIHEPVAARDLGLVALALATHRKETGRLPASLDTLAPGYLDRMPPATQFGHVLRVNRGDTGELALTLVPLTVNVTGSRSYCLDSEGRNLVLEDGSEPTVVEGRCRDNTPQAPQAPQGL